MTFEKQILEKIRIAKLKPTPKGFFQARDILVWGLFGVFLAALSLGIAMTIFVISGTDFGLFEKLGFSTTKKIVSSIPFFWIIASLVGLGVAFINWRHTRRGYRMSAKHFGMYALLIAIGFGSIIYSLDITDYVDKTASEKLPFYNYVMPINTNTWLDPENGLLSGAVRERESDSDFMLRDANAVLWHVVGDDIYMEEGFSFGSGDRIKIIGKVTGLDEFEAIEIRPWEKPVIEGEE